jgi:hypothetical protein
MVVLSRTPRGGLARLTHQICSITWPGSRSTGHQNFSKHQFTSASLQGIINFSNIACARLEWQILLLPD